MDILLLNIENKTDTCIAFSDFPSDMLPFAFILIPLIQNTIFINMTVDFLMIITGF